MSRPPAVPSSRRRAAQKAQSRLKIRYRRALRDGDAERALVLKVALGVSGYRAVR